MSAVEPKIRLAQAEDLSAVVDLLTRCHLPSSDLTAASLGSFIIAESKKQLIGIAGMEQAGKVGLLRSVAVLPEFQAGGLARQLLEATEALSRKRAVLALYLIANDANAVNFFEHAGYATINRDDVPSELKVLPEFTHLCSQSKPCLRKVLHDDFFEVSRMKTLEIYDPAMCCATGVCGVELDPLLVQFAADLQWLAEHGVDVKRYNLGQEPQAFAANPAVIKEMEAGMERLPIIVVGGKIVATGAYLSRAQLAQKLDIALTAEDKPQGKIGSSCCNPKSGCC